MRYINPLSWARGIAMMAVGQMLAAAALKDRQRSHVSRNIPQRRARRGITYAPNGKRECDRHCRQIAAGQLTASNGLVV